MSRLGRGFPNNALMRRPRVSIPVVFDAVGAGKTLQANGLTWSHTFGANASALVFVGYISTTTPTLTCSAGASSMTMVMNQSYIFSANNYCIAAFELTVAPSGATTMSLVLSSGTNYVVANSLSYRNVQSFGSYIYTTGSGTTATQSVTASSGQMIAQAFTNTSGAPNGFSGYNQTQRWNQAGVSSTCPPLVIGDAATAGSISFSAAQTSSTFAGVAIPINPIVLL